MANSDDDVTSWIVALSQSEDRGGHKNRPEVFRRTRAFRRRRARRSSVPGH